MIKNIRKLALLLIASTFIFCYSGCSNSTTETHGEINSYSGSKAGEISPDNVFIQLDDFFTESTEEVISTEEQESLPEETTGPSTEETISEPTDEIQTESSEVEVSVQTDENVVLPIGETTPGETVNASPTNLPNPSDTPKPTNKPTSTSAPKATNKPKATSTPKPTNKPTATSAPEAANKPTATSTPKPTNKPAATSTPKPTNTPAPTNTPKPTNTSTPKPTSKPKPPAETTKNTSNNGTCWITENGKKYHSTDTCSNMKNPIQTTIGDATSRGYSACSKCW